MNSRFSTALLSLSATFLLLACFLFPPAARPQSLLEPTEHSRIESFAPQAARPDILWMRGGHTSPNVHATRFSPNGEMIVTCDDNANAKITRPSDGMQLMTIYKVSCGSYNTFAFSPDSQTIAVLVNDRLVANDEAIEIWRISDKSLVRSIPVTDLNSIEQVNFSPDGTKIVAGLHVYNVADGSIYFYTGTVFSQMMFFSPDGQYIYGSSGNSSYGTVRRTVANPVSETNIGAVNNTYPVAISPNGQYLITDRNGDVVRVSDGAIVHSFGFSNNLIAKYAFTGDGQYVVQARPNWSNTSTVTLTRTSDWTNVWSINAGQTGENGIISVSTHGQSIALFFKNLRLLNLSDGSLIRELTTLGYAQVRSLAFSPNGQTLATANFEPTNFNPKGAIHLWNTADGSRRNVNFPQSVGLGILQIFYTPDGHQLMTYDGSQSIKFWNANDGSLIRSVTETILPSCISLSPNGQIYAVGRYFNGHWHIELRQTSNDAPIRTLSSAGSGIVFSPDGQLLAAGGEFSPIVIFNVATGTVVRTLNTVGNLSRVLPNMTFSPDSQTLAVTEELSSNPGNVRTGVIEQFRISDGALLRTFGTFNGWGSSVVFSPDGQTIGGTGQDATVRLWRVSDGALLQTYDKETGFADSSGGSLILFQIAFSPNGNRFAYGRADSSVVMARNPYATTPPTTFTISGQITRNNSALANVSINLSGNSSAQTTTDSSGNYSFTVAEGGSYTVTPQLANNTFTPASQTFNFISQNQTANFTAQIITRTISGNVKADGTNLAGATVSLSGGQSAATTTDASGNYTFTVPAGANYAVSVYKNGITFNPASQSFTNLQANQTANFQNGTPLCTPQPSGLVAWYKMENNGNDSSGNGNTGNTSVTGFGQGFNGQAMYTAGAQYLTVPDSVSLKPANISLNGWFKMTSVPAAGNFYNLASKYGGDFNGWVLRYRSDQTASFEVYRTSVGGAAVSSATIPINTWVNIAATYDGNTVKIFVNGVQSGNGAFAGGYSPSAIAMQLGKASWTNSEYSSAQIDEFQIYNRALSASEIAAIYNAGSAGVCSSSVATSSSTVSNGKIAFLSSRAGGSEIFTMNADGSSQTNISNNDYIDDEPAWSPDGNKIAFRRNTNGIYLMNDNGSNQVGLTAVDDREPAWSPDGTKIVFFNTSTSNEDIYQINLDASNRLRLTTSVGFDRDPQFSPDGSRIVFASNRDGNNEIYVMDAEGTNQIRLTNNSAYDGFPAFSPDGLKIAFYSNRTGGGDIYVMNADGSNQVNLSNNSAFDGYRPAWSPDGTKIAFETIRDGNNEIYVMNANGTNQTNLTNNNAVDSYPAWQPIRQSVPVAPTANVSLNFSNVLQGGTTSAIALTASQIPALPSGYNLFAGAPIYDIRTSAVYSGNITVSFNVPNVPDSATCSRLRSVHFENGAWTSAGNGATQYNAVAQTCTVSQTVTSLSPFAVVQLPVTAAGVSVSGRVLTADGRGIRNVGVTLTDAQGNTRTTLSSAFGYYRFEDVAAGETVVVTVAAKRFAFSQPQRILNVQEELSEVNFTATSNSLRLRE